MSASGLNANLGFSPEDRTENIRRVGEVAALFADAGMIAITAFISPYRADRAARPRRGQGRLPRDLRQRRSRDLRERDPKGLYKKARTGEIEDFTGISAPYEAPEAAELVIDTTALPIEESVRAVVDYVDVISPSAKRRASSTTLHRAL